ncbi:hypothetical protein [Streptomyces sp. NPDC048560]
MADVRVTAEVFGRLIAEADSTGTIRSLRNLKTTAGRPAKASAPVQAELF